VLNRPVTKPVLYSSRVVPRIGQGVAAGMTEHVDVDREAEIGLLAYSLHLAIEGVGSERRPPFATEHERTRRVLLTPQLPQRPELVPFNRVRSRLAILDPTDVERSRIEIDLRLFQVASLCSP
jgi:hypothetical protein